MRVPLVAIEDQSHRELSGTTRKAWARGGFLDFVRADSRRSFSAGWEFSLRLLNVNRAPKPEFGRSRNERGVLLDMPSEGWYADALEN